MEKFNTIPFIVEKVSNSSNSPYNITLRRGRHDDRENHIEIPQKIYDLFKYEPTYANLTFENKEVDFIGLSSNMKRLLILTCLGRDSDYKRNLSLVDIDSGRTIYVFENINYNLCTFSNLNTITYKGNDYLISHESEGVYILDYNFEDHIHKNQIRPIRGNVFGKTFLFSYAKNKYHIFGLDGEKICESSYEPITKTNGIDVCNLLENDILLTVSPLTISEKNYDYSYTDNYNFLCNVVNTINDTVVLNNVRIFSNQNVVKYKTFVYDIEYNKVSIETTPQIIKTNISTFDFITKVNKLQDLKIYKEQKTGNICICEDVKINTEDKIVSIFDIDKGVFIIEDGVISSEIRDENCVIHDLYSNSIERLKIYFKNAYPNIYEKGKGFLFENDDDTII